MVLVLVIVCVDELSVLRTPHVLDKQHVQRRRELGRETQQPHPYRHAPQQRLASLGGMYGGRSIRRRALIPPPTSFCNPIASGGVASAE